MDAGAAGGDGAAEQSAVAVGVGARGRVRDVGEDGEDGVPAVIEHVGRVVGVRAAGGE